MLDTPNRYGGGKVEKVRGGQRKSPEPQGMVFITTLEGRWAT